MAVRLKAAAKERPFKVVVNEALRAGLRALDAAMPPRAPYRTRGFDLGPSLVGSLDNVEEVLSRIEGERHR